MWARVREIVVKEFRQALREPRMRGILIVPPLLQTIIFGYAVNLDVERVRLAWMDLDQTRQSRELMYRFEASPYFEISQVARSEKEAEALLDNGKAQAVARVTAGFGADVSSGRESAVQVLVDGANSNTASSCWASGDAARRESMGKRPEARMRASAGSRDSHHCSRLTPVSRSAYSSITPWRWLFFTRRERARDSVWNGMIRSGRMNSESMSASTIGLQLFCTEKDAFTA